MTLPLIIARVRCADNLKEYAPQSQTFADEIFEIPEAQTTFATDEFSRSLKQSEIVFK